MLPRAGTLLALTSVASLAGASPAAAQSVGGPAEARAGVVLPENSGPLLRLMPLGDSLTEGVGAFGGYRKPLWERLVLAGTPWNFVGTKQVNSSPGGMDPDHEGHGGYRVSDLIGTGLQPAYPGQLAYWIQQAAPDLVLLHAGTNDVFQAFTWQLGIADVDALLGIVWDEAPDCYVILAEIVPTDLEGFNLEIESFNRGVREIARRRLALGFPLGWVDMYGGVGEFESADNVHPTLPIYEAMAALWKTAIDGRSDAVFLPAMLGEPLAAAHVASSPPEPGYEPLQAINGSGFEAKYGLAVAEHAPGYELPSSWRSTSFDIVWLDGGTPAPAPFQAPMFELELEEPADLTALHLWNGRGVEFLDSNLELDLRTYDTFGSVRVETADAAGVYTDRGVFELRRPPRARMAPGELFPIDWKDVSRLRLTAETLDSGTFAPDNAPGRARVALSEVRVFGRGASDAPPALVVREGGRVGLDLGPNSGGTSYLLWIPPSVASPVGRVLDAGRLDAAGRAHWDGSGVDAFGLFLLETVKLEFLVRTGQGIVTHPVPAETSKLLAH